MTSRPLIPPWPALFYPAEEPGRFPVPPDPPSSGHLTEPQVVARQRDESLGALCFFVLSPAFRRLFLGAPAANSVTSGTTGTGCARCVRRMISAVPRRQLGFNLLPVVDPIGAWSAVPGRSSVASCCVIRSWRHIFPAGHSRVDTSGTRLVVLVPHAGRVTAGIGDLRMNPFRAIQFAWVAALLIAPLVADGAFAQAPSPSEKLNAYVGCINRLSARAVESRARYFSWVGRQQF